MGVCFTFSDLEDLADVMKALDKACYGGDLSLVGTLNIYDHDGVLSGKILVERGESISLIDIEREPE